MAGTARNTRRTRNALVSAAAAGLTLVATACEPQRPTSVGEVATRETLPSGIERVTNALPDDPTPTWTLVEELRVGSADGDGPDVFGELRGLVVLPDGGFAVLDSQAQEVRVFAADGSHRATYGGEGEGPGELRGAHGLMLDPHGRLWVTDPSNSRLSVFDPETGFVDSFRYHFSFYAYIWMGVLTTNDRIVRPALSRGFGFDVYDLNMKLVESHTWKPEGDDQSSEPREDEDHPATFRWDNPGGRGGLSISVPYYPRDAMHYDREGTLWTGTHRDEPPGYRILRRSLAGDTLLIVETRRAPVPVTAEERAAAIEGVREILARRGATIEQDWSKIPAVKPSIANLFTSEEGNIWVQVPSIDGKARWDVLSPDGTWHGTAADPGLNPVTYMPPVVGGDEFWAIVTDAFGVQHVVRARITPSG